MYSNRSPRAGLVALVLAGLVVSRESNAKSFPQTASTNDTSRIESAREDTVRELSLGELLEYAESHSPFLHVARARALVGPAAIEAASPLLPENPELSVAGGPRFESGNTGYDFEVGIAQRFEIAGERGLRIEAAEKFRDLTDAELAEVRWLIHQRIHSLFREASVAKARRAAAEQLLQFTERLLSIAQRRLAAGDISPLPVRVAEGQLAQARQAHIAAHSEYRTVRLTLAEVSGWPPGSLPTPIDGLPDALEAPPQVPLLRTALQNDPRLRVLRATVEQRSAEHLLEKRLAWPKPELGLAYVREAAPELAGDPIGHVAMFSVGIPLPFWQRNQAGRAKAQTDLSIAKAREAAALGSLEVELARAAERVTAGARRVAAYGTEILPSFESNLRLLQRSFELGEIDLLGVLVAQERFLQVQQDALSAYDDYYRAVAELELILGTEIWGGAPLPAEEKK